MTNIFKSPGKRHRKNRLVQIGEQTLQRDGWTVSRERGLGKSSVRRIKRGKESMLVSIRTTQDQWLAFPSTSDGKGWVTLDDVDVVLAVSVDASVPPREALVHWVPAAEMRSRFNAARSARKQANRKMEHGQGIWIPLYEREDASENVSYVGGGAGLDFPPIARVPLEDGSSAVPVGADSAPHDDEDGSTDLLTISEAKRRLAVTLGVPEASIKISVEA